MADEAGKAVIERQRCLGEGEKMVEWVVGGYRVVLRNETCKHPNGASIPCSESLYPCGTSRTTCCFFHLSFCRQVSAVTCRAEHGYLNLQNYPVWRPPHLLLILTVPPSPHTPGLQSVGICLQAAVVSDVHPTFRESGLTKERERRSWTRLHATLRGSHRTGQRSTLTMHTGTHAQLRGGSL